MLDVAKGAVAVLLAQALYQAGPAGPAEWVAAAAGVAAVVGHNWSVFIGFRGGRGVATSAGGLLVISPWTLAVIAPVMAIVVWQSRYVSLGSVVAAAAAPAVTAVLATIGVVGWAAVAYALATGLLIIALARRQPAPAAGWHRAPDRRTRGGELEWPRLNAPPPPRPRQPPRHRSNRHDPRG